MVQPDLSLDIVMVKSMHVTSQVRQKGICYIASQRWRFFLHVVMRFLRRISGNHNHIDQDLEVKTESQLIESKSRGASWFIEKY